MSIEPRKVIGKPVIITIGEAYIKTRYEVKIKKPKLFGNDILDRLMYFGFEIIAVGRWSVRMLLPTHWWGADAKRSIQFYDYKGRLRVIVNRDEVLFVRRYGFNILEDPHKQDSYMSFVGVVMDYASISRIIPLSKEFKLNAIIDSKGDREQLELIYLKECNRYMNNNYPAWQMESMYWDDPVEELVYEDE